MTVVRSRRSWPVRIGLLIAVVGIIGGLLRADSSAAQSSSLFEATANAEAVRLGLSFDPPLVQDELANPAVLAAQASLTSRGESSGYASSPYPGDFPVTVPGLLSSVILQGAFSVPSYPLIASSNHPGVPEQSLAVGPINLSARSVETSSSGVATDGVNRSATTVGVDRTTGTVTAEATTSFASIDLGNDVLSIDGIRSSATARREPGADVIADSEFTVSSLRILGQRVEVTREGLELLGTQLPFGLGGVADALSVLLVGLAGAGIEIEFLPSEITDHGAISAGLQITEVLPATSELPETTVSLILGRAVANVDNRLIARPGPPSGSVDLGVDSFGRSDVLGSLGSPTSGGSGTPTTGPATADLPTQPAGSSITPELVDAEMFYPAMVLGGLALAALSALLRRWGVRPQWTS